MWVLMLLVVAWYGALSNYALLSGLFAANIVPTPPDARGSALNDDGTLFALAAGDATASSALESDSSLAYAQQAARVAEYTAQARKMLPSAAHNILKPTTLTAVAHRRLWVRIVRVENGKSVTADKFLRPGRRYRWSSDSYFVVSAGFVGGARFFLNGKPVDALSDSKFADKRAVLRSVKIYQEREIIVVRKEVSAADEAV
jgi:hypothetical protein